MAQNTKVYFISDAHLGTPNQQSSLEREKKLVSLLEEIGRNAHSIYLMGDIFDFWYEYKHVVPRGYTRLLGKLAELTDSGLPVHYFTGNHDLWAFSYLAEETGMIIHRSPIITEIHGKTFFLAHGDGFDEEDKKFKMIRSIFTNKVLQWFFSRLHPNFAFHIAGKWSRHSRESHDTDPFLKEDEPFVKYARKHLSNERLDYLVFGHRHCPVKYPLSDHRELIILGDWLTNFTYGVFDGTDFSLVQAH